MARVEPAHYAWAAVLGGVAVLDVGLLRRGHAPLSTVCRRSRAGRVAVVVLAVHLIARVPGDPLTALGRLLDAGGRQRA